MAIEEMMNKLDLLHPAGLADSAYENINKWLAGEEYADYWDEIAGLIEAGDINELNDAFYQVIPFGTGGRRGKMGAGSNRINKRTIAESAQGFAEYLIQTFGQEAAAKRGIVVAYDVRNNSRVFADTAAEVFVGNGLQVYFFGDIRSTPQLSFSVRFKGAVGGVMISASHNPPSDNGIKVYWEHGGQVVPPHDANIIKKVSAVKKVKRVDFHEAVDNGKVMILDNSADRAYEDAVTKMSLGDYRDVKIIFTPLHGVGATSFLPVLKRVGFKDIIEVKEQMPADPSFGAVTNQIPNPEVPVSLDLATKYAVENKADLVLASDPDADRIGVVSRETFNNDKYIFLNGNQIAVLLFDYIIKELKKKKTLPTNGVLVKTAVTTDLLTRIAQANGIEVIGDLPVGFKYIADAMEKMGDKKFLFGAEESHGYLYGDYARDKDGAVAALLICERAAQLKQEGKTPYEHLEEIRKEFGYFREMLQDVYFSGMDGMNKMLHIMETLRANLPTNIAGLTVDTVLDQLSNKIVQPKNNRVVGEYKNFPDNAIILYFDPEKMTRLVIRPSGTQPKIKFYAAVGKPVGLDKSDAEFAAIKKDCDDLAHKMLNEIVALADVTSPGGQKMEILG